MLKEKFQVASLFSGAGGFDLGFHLTGNFATHFANELKVTPAKTLAHNLGIRLHDSLFLNLEKRPLMIQGDVADINFSQLDGFRPDILIGGPPCQDFSIVKGGVRKGIEVKRGKLYAHFARGLLNLQPKIFVFENVPGLMSANKGYAYKIVLEDFENLSMRWHEIQQILQTDNGWTNNNIFGYNILFSGVVNAPSLGIPQTRRRLIIIGLRQDFTSGMDLFKLEEIRGYLKHQMCGGDGLVSKYPLTCMEVFEGLPLSELGSKYKEVMKAYRTIPEDLPAETARIWKREVWDNLSFDILKDYTAANKIQPEDNTEIGRAMSEHAEILRELGYLQKPVESLKFEDGTNALLKESNPVFERMRRIPPGENHEFVRNTEWEVEGRGLSLIYRRPFPLKPAPTVVAYGGGGTWGYHYARDRGKLTNRERARIQTFTDDFAFTGTSTEVRAQIGEAVPPRLATKIAESLIEILADIE